MHFNTVIRSSVGADLSRPQPIHRPSIDALLFKRKSEKASYHPYIGFSITQYLINLQQAVKQVRSK